MWRNVGVMLFIFALPVMQVILFCLAIGRDPTGLRLAVANMEMNDTIVSFSAATFHRNNEMLNSHCAYFFYFRQNCEVIPGCSFEHLSCRYLNHLNNTIIKEYYADPQSAVDAVRSGYAWGAVYFTENFTDALVARMALGE